jgi:hypothetical protein
LTHYEILGISGAASIDEIRTAYNTLITTSQANPNSSDEALQFSAQLREAFEVLSDPIRRTQYDHSLYGAPPQQAAVEYVVEEEDPAEVYRREYIQKKQLEKEEAHRVNEAWRKGIFRMMRVVNFVILAVAITQTIDYFLPGRIYEETSFHEWSEQRGGGKHRYFACMIKTAHFTLRVPCDLYYGYHYNADDPQSLYVLETTVFKIPRTISYEDGKKMITLTLPDTIYSFGLTKPLFLLGVTFGILLIRRYNYSTFQFCFMPVCVLFMLLVI